MNRPNWPLTLVVWVGILLLVGILVTLIIIAVCLSDAKSSLKDLHQTVSMITELLKMLEEVLPCLCPQAVQQTAKSLVTSRS